MNIAGWLALATSTATLVSTLVGVRATRKVHTLVNSQHDDLVNRATQLTNSLHTAGIEIPQEHPPGSGLTNGNDS
jgi:hypothetical protein